MPITQDEFIDAIRTASTENGKLNIIEQYIKEHPGSLNEVIHLGTPLGIAMSSGNVESFTNLLMLGADININAIQTTSGSHSLLQLISLEERPTFDTFLDLLLSNKQKINPTTFPFFLMNLKAEFLPDVLKKFSINSTDEHGNSALHLHLSSLTQEIFFPMSTAYFDVRVKNMRALIAAGIDINHQNNHGNTALHEFFRNYHCTIQSSEKLKPILNVLFSNPFLDLTLKNNKGETAADLVPLWHKELYQTMLKINVMYEERTFNNGSRFAFTPKDILDQTALFALDNRTGFSRADADIAESKPAKNDTGVEDPKPGK